MKQKVFFISGPSAAGKSTFEKIFLDPIFEKLVSMVIVKSDDSPEARIKRDGEVEGKDYYFVDKSTFEKTARITTLDIDVQKDWRYGISEYEFHEKKGHTPLYYDVMQPQYIKQFIDWAEKNKEIENIDFKVLYLQAKKDKIQKNLENRLEKGTESKESINIRQSRNYTDSSFKEYDLNIDYNFNYINDEVPEELLEELFFIAYNNEIILKKYFEEICKNIDGLYEKNIENSDKFTKEEKNEKFDNLEKLKKTISNTYINVENKINNQNFIMLNSQYNKIK